MKATTLLERQQRDLQQLCEAIQLGSAGMRASLLPQLASDLVAHMAVEEQVFYPAACEALHEDTLVCTCRSGNQRARTSLRRALEAPVEGAEFASAIGELRSAVERHVEEEKVLFSRLERVLDARAMGELGRSMLSAYQKLEEGDAGLA
jgi:hemerythrin-like domain-containing protein